jgi:hypothetical protein
MQMIRSEKGMAVGMLDKQTGTLQIKDGSKMWHIPIPPNGMTVTTRKGTAPPEKTYIPFLQ